MAKVLLVEDDNNLREIYEARLQAEGYETVTASDGEQALAVAKDARPDLVISDVMMPKISGFEMLDILRNTDGLKDVKVIMLTALGQAEDKTRADQLGANKYLVKSQVTLEDIVKTAHQLLDDGVADASSAVATDTPATPAVSEPPQQPTATPTVTEPASAPVVPATPAATPEPPAATIDDPAAVTASASTEQEEQATMEAQINQFAQAPAEPTPAVDPTPGPVAPTPEKTTPETVPQTSTPVTSPETPTTAPPATHDEVMAAAVDDLTDAVAPDEKPSDVTAVEVPPAPSETSPQAVSPETTVPAPNTPVAATGATDSNDGVTIAHKKIIQPISDPTSKPDINQLLAKEEAAATATEPIAPPQASTTVTPQPNDPNDPNSVAL